MTTDNTPTTPDTVTRVEIDPNVRVHGNLGRVGLEDADGPLTVGQDVTVYEPESGLTGPGRVERIDTDKQLVFLVVQWSELRPAEAPHACSNCEGVDPDTCLTNPDRPRGGQPAPAPVDPALRDRVATVLFGAVSTANETPTATEQIIFDRMAAAVLAELAPELARAEQGRRQDERDEIETATALARSRAVRTMSCGHHITSRCPDCNEIERGLRKQLSSALENLGAAIAHDRQPYPTAWAYQQACTALGAQRERAEEAEAALAAGIPLICTDERHQAKVVALEGQVRRLGDLIDRLGPTEQKHRDDLATARAILADLTDPDPCWYDHHGYCQAHAWLATDPACPHARAKALTPTAAPEDTP